MPRQPVFSCSVMGVGLVTMKNEAAAEKESARRLRRGLYKFCNA